MAEMMKCHESFHYFVENYVYILDATSGTWIPFNLWPGQIRSAELILNSRLTVILKARQLGLTWLCLAYALWKVLFRPIATVLLFSRRDDEAIDLLDGRLKKMYRKLPYWLQADAEVINAMHHWQLSTESQVFAFPTTAGDSYTASLVIVDEADLVPDLNALMRAVKPTIDAGGEMILLSRADKGKPQSEFKRLFRASQAGKNSWASIFLPWYTRPSRDNLWYEDQKRDILSRTGSLDDLYEQYPATATEAMAPKSLDKRIPFKWLQAIFDAKPTLEINKAPSIPGLNIYQAPLPGSHYVIGGDPAEGNPTSDDSAAIVLDIATGEEVASLQGKFQPSLFAEYLSQLAEYYHRARILVERNNHGHAVILYLQRETNSRLLKGYDKKYGWYNTSKGKALLYSIASDYIRNGEVIIRTENAFYQLSQIEGDTLSAPEGEHDDMADAYALSCAAIEVSAGLKVTTGMIDWWQTSQVGIEERLEHLRSDLEIQRILEAYDKQHISD